MSVSIVIPIYNEEEIVDRAVKGLLLALEKVAVPFEVILAENGSTDATLSIAQSLAANDCRVKVIHLALPDYGQAMRQGFLAASSDFLVNFSIDLINLDFLQEALRELERSDVVLGSKYVARGYDRRPLARRIGGRLLSRFVRVLFGLSVSDTHGLMGLRREKVIALLERCHFGHEIFDTELVVRAHQVGLSIREIPMFVEEERPSRMGSLRRALRMLIQLVRLRLWLWREGPPT